MKSIVYFKALSDETRIRLLNILLHHELSVNEIVALMKMGQSRISRHLKILTDSGLLECRRDGIWAFYSAVKEGPARRFMDTIRYLFADETSMQKDLFCASQILEDRRRKTKHFFNTIASEWDLLKHEILGEFDLNAAILQQVDRCSVAVDLGCGTGDLLASLKASAMRVIGVDSSSKMLDEARKRFQNTGGSVELRLGELEHLPIGNEDAEVAVISMVMHHLLNPAAVVAEAYRILRPGGIFIIADFDKHTNETMRKTYGDRWLGFSRHEIELLLMANGFTLINGQSHELKQSLTISIYQSIKRIKQ